jgi:hypothetical protein
MFFVLGSCYLFDVIGFSQFKSLMSLLDRVRHSRLEKFPSRPYAVKLCIN